MNFHFTYRGQSHTVELQGQGNELQAVIGSQLMHAAIERGQPLTLTIDGRQVQAAWAKAGRSLWLHIGGRSYQLLRVAGGRAGGLIAGAERNLRAPMPGQVRKVLVQPGQHVTTGSVLLLLEAMKMEVRITAGQDAKVAQVNVLEGQSVDKDQLLIELEPADGG